MRRDVLATCTGLLMWNAIGPAWAEGPTVVVVANVSDTSQANSAADLEAMLRARLEEAGLVVAQIRTQNKAPCRTDACLLDLRESSQAQYALFVSAAYRKDNSFNVSATTFDLKTGRELANKSSECSLVCTRPDMHDKLNAIVAEAVKSLPTTATVEEPITSEQPVTPPEPPPALAEPTETEIPVVASREPEHPSPIRPWVLMGTGAALATAGIITISQHGDLTGCKVPGNDDTCPYEWNTVAWGAALMAAGGLAVVAGALDLAGVFQSRSPSANVSVRLGPTGASILGSF